MRFLVKSDFFLLLNMNLQALGEEEEEEEKEEKSKDGEEDENEGSMLSESLLLLQTKNLAAGEDVESQLVEDSKDSRRGKIYSGLKWGR